MHKREKVLILNSASLANSTAVEASLREKITTLNKNKQEVSKSKEELTKLRQQISAKAVAAQEGQQNA